MDTTSSASRARVLDGKAVARAIREEVAAGCAALRASHGIVPGLTVVLVGEACTSTTSRRD